MYPNLPLSLTCLILLPLPYTYACLQPSHPPGRPLNSALRSPACQGYTCTVFWGGRLGCFCTGAASQAVRRWPSPTRPRLVGRWARRGAGTGHGAEVPTRTLGGWGKSGWNSCSAEVSVGIASIANQHAQLWFFSLMQLRKTVYETR